MPLLIRYELNMNAVRPEPDEGLATVLQQAQHERALELTVTTVQPEPLEGLATVLQQAQHERTLELTVTTVRPEPVEGLGDSASRSSARAGSRAQHGRTLK